MIDYKHKLLSVFCDYIHAHRGRRGLEYIGVFYDDDSDYYTKASHLQPILYSFYSLYQYCRFKNININNIVTEEEKTKIFDLIVTMDILNIELAKQVLIVKIRECMKNK